MFGQITIYKPEKSFLGLGRKSVEKKEEIPF
jgi:hypothetical protein